jgi:hypothetical protein
VTRYTRITERDSDLATRGVASEVPPAIQDNFRLLRVRFRGYFRLRLGIFPVVSTVIVGDLFRGSWSAG